MNFPLIINSDGGMEMEHKKNAILFGQTNGFSIVMTALSLINLKKKGYRVQKPECRRIQFHEGEDHVTDKNDWGTANAPLFWESHFRIMIFPG
jgi:hypothetical protein